MKKLFLILFIIFGFFLYFSSASKANAVVYCSYCPNSGWDKAAQTCKTYTETHKTCELKSGQICDPKRGCIPAPEPGTPGSNCVYCATSGYIPSQGYCTDIYEIPKYCTLQSGQICDTTKGCTTTKQINCSYTSCTTNSDCCSNVCKNGACIVAPGSPDTKPPGSGPSLPTYGGEFGGPNTTFSCGSGINAVWTLDCIFPLFASLILWALTLAGTIGVIFIILGGIRYILSGGDPKKVDQARKIILFAVVGLVVIFLSFFILSFIGKTTGVACLKPNAFLSFTSCP